MVTNKNDWSIIIAYVYIVYCILCLFCPNALRHHSEYFINIMLCAYMYILYWRQSSVRPLFVFSIQSSSSSYIGVVSNIYKQTHTYRISTGNDHKMALASLVCERPPIRQTIANKTLKRMKQNECRDSARAYGVM